MYVSGTTLGKRGGEFHLPMQVFIHFLIFSLSRSCSRAFPVLSFFLSLSLPLPARPSFLHNNKNVIKKKIHKPVCFDGLHAAVGRSDQLARHSWGERGLLPGCPTLLFHPYCPFVLFSYFSSFILLMS